MSEKIWKFRHKDTVAVTEKFDESIGAVAPHRTAAHPPEKGGFVIVYDKKDQEVCYIHSDEKIAGLELLAENVEIGRGTDGHTVQR